MDELVTRARTSDFPRSVPVETHGINAGAMSDQQLSYLLILWAAEPASPMESRFPLFIDRMHIGTMSKQTLYHRHLRSQAGLAGQMEGRPPLFIDRMHVGALCKQKLDYLQART